LRAAIFYAAWYPSRWLGWGHWPQYAEFGALAKHLRWVERTSRRLARAQFHLMIAHGPALEKRQALLFRCVDIGAELFAMAAVCTRAVRDLRTAKGEGSPAELADLFCRLARARIENAFEAIRSNADPQGDRVARGVLDGRYDWLEDGIADAPDASDAATPPRKDAAAGA
jgi:hypothetical protein